MAFIISFLCLAVIVAILRHEKWHTRFNMLNIQHVAKRNGLPSHKVTWDSKDPDEIQWKLDMDTFEVSVTLTPKDDIKQRVSFQFKTPWNGVDAVFASLHADMLLETTIPRRYADAFHEEAILHRSASLSSLLWLHGFPPPETTNSWHLSFPTDTYIEFTSTITPKSPKKLLEFIVECIGFIELIQLHKEEALKRLSTVCSYDAYITAFETHGFQWNQGKYVSNHKHYKHYLRALLYEHEHPIADKTLRSWTESDDIAPASTMINGINYFTQDAFAQKIRKDLCELFAQSLAEDDVNSHYVMSLCEASPLDTFRLLANIFDPKRQKEIQPLLARQETAHEVFLTSAHCKALMQRKDVLPKPIQQDILDAILALLKQQCDSIRPLPNPIFPKPLIESLISTIQSMFPDDDAIAANVREAFTSVRKQLEMQEPTEATSIRMETLPPWSLLLSLESEYGYLRRVREECEIMVKEYRKFVPKAIIGKYGKTPNEDAMTGALSMGLEEIDGQLSISENDKGQLTLHDDEHTK